MSTTTAKGSGSTVNNGGTVVGGGNVPAGSPMTKVIGVNELNTGREYGSKLAVDTDGGAADADPHGVTKAKSAGTFAYTPAQGTNFLIRGAGDNASKVNNSASTVLSIPGGVSTNGSIHKTVSTYRLGSYSNTSFDVLARPNGDVVPGRTRGTGAGSQSEFVEMDGATAASDDAATPTRSVPGELTYMFGSVVPKQDDYKAKNSYES
jgi:hypothetical protein